MSSEKFETLTTANGYFRMATFSGRKAWKVSLLLMFRYGFLRWGVLVPPVAGEGSYPDFIKGGLKIEAGFDGWFGYDWCATNEQTDCFLKKFYERYCSAKA